ncbi:MAG: bifunctional [glutamate--ammonia ligase]-adenylyl-L-tyrosine phosphorylase/[glutamate--ammonia-ligase] adenylyltransferase [Burkholderiaceae bacterium]|nr:bifunctional [glutamate--ammonia ligase]-adenylyl-L-tyrosine phosphorylase/[glutamate--ammonia-ligase] adenylyltransferase [Burkholderiaceae bacterium]
MTSADQDPVAGFAAEAHSGWFCRALGPLRARDDGSLDALRALVAAPVTPQAIRDLWRVRCLPAAASDGPEATLRRFRNLVMMAIMERDLRGLAPLPEVCAANTALAQTCIEHALHLAAREFADAGRTLLDDEGKPQDVLVVAMGKLGGGELNASSDVDLVYVMRDQGASLQAAERITRRMTQLLAQPTGDGFVFRVDTRLRPYGDSGPPVTTLGMLEQYFYEQGREWERFAWLKARVIATSGLAPAEATEADEVALMQLVTPFVFRRYLDYDAFSALARVHDLIREEAGREALRRERGENGGFDVKLGRGGIREVEFSAQLFQIVRGGQDPLLRERSTPGALRRLAQRRLLEPETVQALIDAWTLLRRTEHALQYQEDEQTHWLPQAEERRTAIAAMLGMDAVGFDAALTRARQAVATVFDDLLAPARGETPPAAGADANAGEPPAVALDEDGTRRIAGLRESRRYRLASADTRERIERLLERSLRLGPSADPDDGTDSADIGTWIGRLCDLLESIAGRPAYLTLLDEHPAAFAHLLRIVAKAKWAAEYLLLHPVVLDELLDGQLLEPLDCERWGRELREQLAATTLAGVPGAPAGPDAPDVERQMDAMREAHHGAVFRLLAQDLEGKLTVEALGDQLSALADQVLQITMELVWSQLPRRHRETPRFTIVAYGKLGGKELGYASDLDLVFLYEDEHEDALQRYSQLAQRIANWMSTRTAAGLLFEIDLRLRPNGNAGLLVSSLRAFELYQTESAWMWEHQALTRARACAGDPDIGQRFEELRRSILARPRDRTALANEILAMRSRMHEGHPNRSALFDLKHDAGGMVDIEFMVQYLVLAWGATCPELLDNKGNIELLRRCGAAGLLDADEAAAIADIYRHYRKLQHALRLNDAEYARVAPESVAEQVRRVRDAWHSVFGIDRVEKTTA